MLSRFLVVGLLMLSLAACAGRAEPQAMVVEMSPSFAAPEQSVGQYAVGDVSGGEETNPGWTSEIDNAGFRQALSDSLVRAGYALPGYSGVPYRVDAHMVRVDQPFFGLTYTVTITVDYTVTGPDETKTFTITDSGTATFSDSPAAVIRLQRANEKAVKENITSFLKALTVDQTF
jgi:hypothetical protein